MSGPELEQKLGSALVAFLSFACSLGAFVFFLFSLAPAAHGDWPQATYLLAMSISLELGSIGWGSK